MSLAEDDPGATLGAVHVGRQPIYDAALGVLGHELLFRPHASASAAGDGLGDAATAAVMVHAFTTFGAAHLLGDGLGFVNLTRSFIVGAMPVPLPSSVAVLELLETVHVDDEVRTGVRELTDRGFAFALDDFLWSQTDRIPLLDSASYVKVDISQVPPEDLPDTVDRLRAYDAALVAEHVETAEDLEMCRGLGFDLFQGYYLLRPETLTQVTLSPTQLACLELLATLADPDLTFEQLEALVRVQPGLAYRVLQTANAAWTGLPHHLESVHQALVMLGVERLRAWVMLMVAVDTGASRPEHLAAALTRARMCELLATTARVRRDVAFTAGLLSRFDVVLGVPLGQVLEGLPLSTDLSGALLEYSGPLGALLGAVQAYESGVPHTSGLRGMTGAYLEAVAWTRQAIPLAASVH